MIETKRETIINYFEDIETEALEFLERLVKIDSYSQDKSGVDQVSNLIRDKLEAEGIECEIIKNEKYGNLLMLQLNGFHISHFL